MNETKHLLGKRIKNLRNEKNLTQEQLAELAGIEKRNLSNIENGHTFPSKFLVNIAKALKVTLPELFDFDHLKVDREYMEKYISQNVKELSDENITILYRMTKSMR